MTVGRNDPCTCGSGKKYKQCCLKIENKKQQKIQARERFYNQKQALVERIGDFLVQQVPIKRYNALKSIFKERTKNRIGGEMEESYFTFWLFFFHRFENGYRGIEWFFEANQDSLLPAERTMIETWKYLKMRLLKAVDETKEAVIFKDVLNKETFPVSKDEENLAHFNPWVCTMAFLELFDDLYYFNGLHHSTSPYNLEHALAYMNEIKDEKGRNHQQVLEEYFPEMIAALIEPIAVHEKEEAFEYVLNYTIENPVIVGEFLRAQEDMKVETWGMEKQKFVWVGNWRAYRDNAFQGTIKLADAYGHLTIHVNELTYTGFNKKDREAMKKRLEPVAELLVLESEEENDTDDLETKSPSTMVMMDEQVPEYLAYYAQNEWFQRTDSPISFFDGKTLQDLIEDGRESEALIWLENQEYSIHRQMENQFKDVQVTADFNTIRRELNLPQSPFVTKGTERESTYQSIEVKQNPDKLYQSDIPFLEAIGFTSESSKRFFTSDLLRFFKERTSTQTKNEAIQTTSAIHKLRELLEQQEMNGWQPEAKALWKQVLFDDYMKQPEYTREKHRAFLQEMEVFFAWMAFWHSEAYEIIRLLVSQEIEKEA